MQGLIPGDDILVVGDGYHEPTKRIVEMFGPPFRYVATRQTRDWGHSQANYGLQNVKGDYIIAQDDDDIFLPRAFDEVRDIVSKFSVPHPIIGRVMTPFLGILWSAPGVEPLDGHCLVIPNDKKKVGYFGIEYEGDQKWLRAALESYDDYTWADRIWSLTRPKFTLWPRLTKDPNTMDRCYWTFHRTDRGIWAEEPAIRLYMRWDSFSDDQHWDASIQRLDKTTTLDEVEEVVQFAAWAGQGNNVRVCNPEDGVISRAALRSGYKIVPYSFNYEYAWPPHKFEPAEEQT